MPCEEFRYTPTLSAFEETTFEESQAPGFVIVTKETVELFSNPAHVFICHTCIKRFPTALSLPVTTSSQTFSSQHLRIVVKSVGVDSDVPYPDIAQFSCFSVFKEGRHARGRDQMAKEDAHNFPNIPSQIDIEPSQKHTEQLRKEMAEDILTISEFNKANKCFMCATDKEPGCGPKTDWE
ncbi:uncharacterized protein LOC115163674 [Salmo trutta]|uniref:uncharacterized protein LOC115163674 n=1 Tax=Salmo trutta TaxID=8032 RepID=UPI0011310D00|nr:uncharacterized protein LOC115163674 [Salmo trutta]